MRSSVRLVLAGIAIGIIGSVLVTWMLGAKETQSATLGMAGADEVLDAQTPTPREVSDTPRSIDPLAPAAQETKEMEMPHETIAQVREEAFQERMGKVFSGQATADEEIGFWKWVRESGQIDTYIKQLEGATPMDSPEIQSQMDLANLYVAKIYSVPNGPEAGLWAMKAEQRWRAVLEIDPTHWGAQNSVAFSLSQYPDFLNKTGEAIKEYEKLVTIQENADPQPQHAQTFLALYRLYQKRGDPGNAVDALNQGLERFPDNKALLEQRNSISTLTIP